MRIKELKLHGFKAFANKTTIKFDENFIGIVGPNGSGKSNIIDAIRWVFGEQSSKSLRGNNAGDVIFSGTETRKQQNIAEVTLILDNSDRHLEIDYEDVSITRRVYRTGSSEYFLNGTECRLKDINELIMDKGIGKSSFSIISQGKVDEIVVVNADSRRQIVEEVAGILKYKKRKENTKRKLEKTDLNLQQVSLVLNEMNDRLLPLKKQAHSAVKFKEFQSELETKEISLLANKIFTFKDEFDAVREILQDIKIKNINLEKQETQLSLDEQDIRTKIRSNQQRLEIENKEINELIEMLTKHRNDFQIIQEKRRMSKDANSHVIELENNLAKAEEEISATKIKIEQLAPQNRNILAQKNESTQKIEKLKTQIYRLNQIQNDIESELSRQTLPFATRKIIESHVIKAAKTVVDSFQVKDEHAEAISTLIGGRLYDLVVENTNDAQSAIKYLRENKLGRQTFLPKNDMKPLAINEQVKSQLMAYNGYVGTAYELVEVEAGSQNVFKNLLGNVIVCKTMNDAYHIKKQITNNYRIVTLDGEILTTSGALTGGRVKRQNKLILENNLRAKQKEIAKVKEELSKLEANAIVVDQKYIEITNDLAMANNLLARQQNNAHMIKLELSDILGEESTSNHEVEKLKVKIELDSQRVEKLNAQKMETASKIENLQNQEEEIRHKIREISEELKLNLREQNELEITHSKLEYELKQAQEILSEEYSLSYQLAFEKAQKGIDIDQYQQDVSNLKRKIRGLGPVNVLAIEEYDEVKQKYDFINVQKDDLIQAKTRLEEIINKLDIFFIEAFDETYNKLRIEFQMVFTELFGGGKADLILTNPDDLLTSGIEIVAQPPGKKLQTISLLSGGEKALTAISLLFAILRIRVLPFAILDEVEAALDEVNVKRYAQYIKAFSERTQFIVITHRQGTMETADALYGITMQEQGVSSVVSVNLQEGDNNDQTV